MVFIDIEGDLYNANAIALPIPNSAKESIVRILEKSPLMPK